MPRDPNPELTKFARRVLRALSAQAKCYALSGAEGAAQYSRQIVRKELAAIRKERKP